MPGAEGSMGGRGGQGCGVGGRTGAGWVWCVSVGVTTCPQASLRTPKSRLPKAPTPPSPPVPHTGPPYSLKPSPHPLSHRHRPPLPCMSVLVLREIACTPPVQAPFAQPAPIPRPDDQCRPCSINAHPPASVPSATPVPPSSQPSWTFPVQSSTAPSTLFSVSPHSIRRHPLLNKSWAVT